MANLRLLYLYFKIWTFRAVLFLALAGTFFYWAESQMNASGGFRDAEYWEMAMASTDKVGDLMPLSGFLHQRVAEMMMEPKRNQEGLLIFAFMDHIFKKAEPTRKISDLKYALWAYKKQIFIASPFILRIYLSIRHYFGAGVQNGALNQDLISDSGLRLENLAHLKTVEATGDVQAVREMYGKILASPEFSNFQAPVMLQLAFFLYEKDPAEARQWLEQLKKKKPSVAVSYAAAYLRRKLNRKMISSKRSFKSAESEVENFFKMGLFEQVATQILNNKNLLFSSQMEEMQGWLGLKSDQVLKDKQSFFSIYCSILGNALKEPVEASNQLVKLAIENHSAAFSALLRFQAWSLAYFDAKDYSRAFFISEFLKLHDPLSLYSQLEAIKGMFRPSAKSFSGSKLMQAWQAEPYRFDMVRKDIWTGFKEGRRHKSETRVHEGHVFVVNYNESGQADKLQEVDAGESVSTQEKTTENLPEPAKMGWVDQFFYGIMIKFIPLGVQTFKQKIWKLAQNLEAPVFTRLYKQDEFQFYILDKMRLSLGTTVQAMQAEIDERGFSIYAVFNLKLIKVAVSGLGKLLVDEDGQLILKLDHVRVGKIHMPKWLLKHVENNFNLSAHADEDSDVFLVDILSMKYQAGGILIECRKKSF